MWWWSFFCVGGLTISKLSCLLPEFAQIARIHDWQVAWREHRVQLRASMDLHNRKERVMPANTGLTESEYRQFDALCDSAKDLARKRSPEEVRQLLHALQHFKDATLVRKKQLFLPAHLVEQNPSVSHIVLRMTIPVDRDRLFEVQLAELAEEGKIRGDWWEELTSEHYPADKSRPSTITLGECHFNKLFKNADAVKEAIKNEQGVVRNGDPYEFCAWLRHQPQVGLEYPILALDQLWLLPGGRGWYAPVIESGDWRSVGGRWVGIDLYAIWRFLVVCESE